MKIHKITFILLISIFVAACRNAGENPTTEPAEAVIEEQPTAIVEGATERPSTSSESESETASQSAPEPTSLPQPATSTPQPPADPEVVTVEAADGLTIFGTFYPGAGSGPWPAAMLLHMNGGQRSDWDDFARQLADEGYAALAVDMRGHGETGSQSDWQQAPDDLRRVWNYLTSRDDVDATRAAVAGASIGANMSLVTGASDPTIKTVIIPLSRRSLRMKVTNTKKPNTK